MNDQWPGHHPDDQTNAEPNDWQSRETPPSTAAPPTSPGALNPRYSCSVWPKVFGIISIVFGSFTMLSMTCSLALLPFMSQFAQFMQPPPGQSTQNLMTGGLPIWWYIPSSVVSLSLGVLQFSAGIFLLGRKPKGVALHKLWAKIFLAYCVISYPISFWMQWQAGAYHSGGAFGLAIGITTWIITAGIAIAYPIVLLFWLNKPTVRSEYKAW